MSWNVGTRGSPHNCLKPFPTLLPGVPAWRFRAPCRLFEVTRPYTLEYFLTSVFASDNHAEYSLIPFVLLSSESQSDWKVCTEIDLRSVAIRPRETGWLRFRVKSIKFEQILNTLLSADRHLGCWDSCISSPRCFKRHCVPCLVPGHPLHSRGRLRTNGWGCRSTIHI